MREREIGRCLHCVTAAACGEEEDKRLLPLCFLCHCIFLSHIVYFTACGLSWFFPLLWVFHVISCVSTLPLFSEFDCVHTSSIRLWPNDLVNLFLSKWYQSKVSVKEMDDSLGGMFKLIGSNYLVWKSKKWMPSRG